MDFYRNQWVPARSVHPEFMFKTPDASATTRRVPKVVQIPVHFVGSEASRSASALKIQKVFRGFMVRKSVKKIVRIKREVDAVEARVSQREVVDLIRNDRKERLKVNETLMALLFKLDAVSGCGDSGIRVCRKAVIRKAIALQEKVDSIANGEFQENADAGGEVELLEPHEKSLTGTGCSVEDALYCDRIQENNTNNDGDVVLEKEDDDGKAEVGESHNQAAADVSNICNNSQGDEDGCGSSDEYECVEQKVAENCDKPSEMERDDAAPAPGSEFQADSSLMEEEEVNEEGRSANAKTPALSECMEMDDDVSESEMMGEQRGIAGDNEKIEKKKESNKLLVRMVEENGKLMKMMTELFERNEAQGRMLNTLTHRLEQLEKAFVCDKIKRKKKRHST